MNDLNNEIENNSLTEFYNNCLEGNQIQNNKINENLTPKNTKSNEIEQYISSKTNFTSSSQSKLDLETNDITNLSTDNLNKISEMKNKFNVILDNDDNSKNIKNSLTLMIKNYIENTSNDIKTKTKKFESDIIGLEKTKYHYYKIYKSFLELSEDIFNLDKSEADESDTIDTNNTIDNVKESLKKSTISSNISNNNTKIIKKDLIRNKTPLRTQVIKDKFDDRSMNENKLTEKIERSKTPAKLGDNIGVPSNVSKRIESRRKSKTAREENKEEKIVNSTTNKSKSPLTFHRNNQNPMSKSGNYTGAIKSSLKDVKKLDTDTGFNKSTISNLRKSRSKIKDSKDDTISMNNNITNKYVKKHVNYQHEKDNKDKNTEVENKYSNIKEKSVNKITKKDVSTNKNLVTKEKNDTNIKENKKNHTTNFKSTEVVKKDKNDLKKENSTISNNKSVVKDSLTSSNSVISSNERKSISVMDNKNLDKIDKVEKIEKVEKVKTITKVKEFKNDNMEILYLIIERG